MTKLKVTAIVFFIAFGTLNGQDALTFSKVVNTDSVGQSTLFVSINNWFASTYNSANNVIQMSDKDAGIIVGNGSMDYSFDKLSYLCYDGYIKYTIKVYVKDNRFKVELTNFSHSVKPFHGPQCALGLITTSEIYTDKGMSKNYHNNVWVDIKSTAEQYANSIFNSIQTKVKSLNQEMVEDDW